MLPNVGPYKPKKIMFFLAIWLIWSSPLSEKIVFFFAIWLIWSNPLSEKIVFFFRYLAYMGIGLYGPTLGTQFFIIKLVQAGSTIKAAL